MEIGMETSAASIGKVGFHVAILISQASPSRPITSRKEVRQIGSSHLCVMLKLLVLVRHRACVICTCVTVIVAKDVF